LANTVALTVPERVVLFGGIARNGDLLMAPLQQYFHQDLLFLHQGKVELLLSALPEDDAGILGAAALTALAD
jgi:glucokinase